MKKPKKKAIQNINTLFEEVVMNYIPSNVMKDSYTMKFEESLRQYGVSKYIEGSNSCFNALPENVKKYLQGDKNYIIMERKVKK